MQIRNIRPRADLNDGQPHEPRKVTALHLWLALHQVRSNNPIKTLRAKK